MATLYDLSTAHRQFAIEIADLEEIPADLAQRLDALDDAIADKVRNRVAMRRELMAEAEVFRAEARHYTELARRRERSADWLEADTIRCLDLVGIDSVKTPLGNVRVQRAGKPSIRWEGDLEIAPSEFVRTKLELDGTAAQAALKAGNLPDGFIVTYSRGLRVG